MGMPHLLAIMEPSKAVQHRLLNPPPSVIAPSNTQIPILYGSKINGQTLVCLVGDWSGTLPFTYSFQWRRDGTAIVGATSYQYVVTVPDVSASITCTVTATNTAGSISALSAVI